MLCLIPNILFLTLKLIFLCAQGIVDTFNSSILFKRKNQMNITRNIAVIALSGVLLALSACGSTNKRESTGQYVDDSVITTKVKAAIFNEPTLKSAEINVETYKGVVQLSGFVSTQAQTYRAVEVARGVQGVSSVKNDMRIK